MKKLDIQVKHWQDVMLALLGLWTAVAPWALDFADRTGVLASSIALGMAIFAAGAAALFAPQAWQHWTTLALGIVLGFTPWLLEFSGAEHATRHALATGIATALLSLWLLAKDGALRGVSGWRTAGA